MSKKNNEVIKITVLNWNEYQNKRGGDWFKMYHDIVYSNSLSKLPPYVKWLFVCVLCECSRKSQGDVEFVLSSFSRRAELKPSWCRVGFKLMSERSLIARVSGDFGASRLDKIRLDKIRLDKQVPPAAVFDFESFYKKYPRKIGKKNGFKTFKKEITTQEKFNAINKALENYLNEITKQKTQMRYVAYFSTFMNNWEDYLDLSHYNSYTKPMEKIDVFG